MLNIDIRPHTYKYTFICIKMAKKKCRTNKKSANRKNRSKIEEDCKGYQFLFL